MRTRRPNSRDTTQRLQPKPQADIAALLNSALDTAIRHEAKLWADRITYGYCAVSAATGERIDPASLTPAQAVGVPYVLPTPALGTDPLA